MKGLIKIISFILAIFVTMLAFKRVFKDKLTLIYFKKSGEKESSGFFKNYFTNNFGTRYISAESINADDNIREHSDL